MTAAAWDLVVGLEVHCQLLTATKIFCGCANRFGDEPNTNVCPVCLGLPGALPVLSRHAVALALRAALATGCSVRETSVFARKNYFYPDLPKGYQISQYDRPLAEHGTIVAVTAAGERTVRITRVHMEEDAGKLLHEGLAWSGEKSGVDLNRAGVPLIEIVSEPDLRSPEEAHAYLTALKAILEYAAVSDCNMEQGSLRCDANVSVRRAGEERLGTRVEIKNLNSFRNVSRAIEHERARQIAHLEAGHRILQETRLFDPDRGATVAMRSKEEAHDYRYFPEPDLVPLAPSPDWIEEIRRSLPELPEARRARFVAEYGLPDYDARVLTDTKARADYFEAVVRTGGDPKQAGNWIKDELLGLLNKEGKEIEQSPIPPERLGELLRLLQEGTISGKIAKAVFEEMYGTGEAPADIVREKGLVVIADAGALEAVVEQVLAAHPAAVAELRAGKAGSKNFLVGQVMKATQGKADPKLVNDLLTKKLAS